MRHSKRRSNVKNRHLKQDDALNRAWWSVLSIDKLVTWQHLSIERTGGHVVLKASSCLRSLMSAGRREFLNKSFVAVNTLHVSDFTKKCTRTEENRH